MNHGPAPPPPPPHGDGPKSAGLPPGNYDIFIIPPHSSGSGFLYLPSLRPNVNSFAAGFATALVLVAICSAITPAIQAWWHSVKGAGGMGMIMVVLGIAVGAWALGRTQSDGGPGPGGGSAGPQAHANTHANTPPRSDGGPPPSQANQGSYQAPPSDHGYHPGAQQHSYQAPPPQQQSPPPPHSEPEAAQGEPERPKPTWQRSTPTPGAGGPAPNTPLSAWERAREETKKREAERKAAEAVKQRKEEVEKKLKELREKDAREREAREARLKQAAEKRAAEEKRNEQPGNEKRDDARHEAGSKTAPSAYAFSSMGEKTNPWPKGRPSPSDPPPRSTTPPPRAAPASPIRKPPPPTARTYLGTDDDAHSFRPYDNPRRPTHKKSQSSIYSESSYAASQSTAQTTPPTSHRMPYSTKDPDKIVIKAVYSFTNSFLKTPTSQLVSGVGSVTDGLILRITTEGLFIDDDVRGVPQREWDVKAWTMKLVEVWCPAFSSSASAFASAFAAASAASASASANPHATTAATRAFTSRPTNPVRRLWNLEKDKAATNEEADALLADFLSCCKNHCRLSSASDSASDSSRPSSAASIPLRARDPNNPNAHSSSASFASRPAKSNVRASQTGENKASGLHVLRASIRDTEGKRYVFILTAEESWKVAVGLQRLRKGSQVRALGVSGMSSGDARSTLENLGW